MKIVMFTPALRTSAIGRMAALVARAWLAEGHELTVVRAEASVLHVKPMHDFGVEVMGWDQTDLVKTALAGADMVVHHIGNNYDYHEGNLIWLESAPAIVCMHDFYLGHLFFGWAQTRHEAAKRELARWYGPDAPERFYAYANRADFIDLTSKAMPMTQWIASRAAGVVAHSSWGIDAVMSSCEGPVWTLPLAYDICDGHGASALTPPDGKGEITLLTVGHVNRNKRIEEVIRAIGSSDTLRERVIYRIVGKAEPSVVMSLTELAMGMNVRVVMTGEVDDAALSDAFSNAFAISCLRWPSLESASASAIEAMLHGKTILVSDNGFYSELPDDCVMKISVGDPREEVAAIRGALETLLSQPEKVHAMGRKAKVWATDMFSADSYARNVCDMSGAVQRAAVLRRTGVRFAEMLRGWGGDARAMTDASVTGPLGILAAAGS